MSLYELPENLIKAIVDEGMKTAWKESLSLPTEAARTRAKAIIRKRIMESRELKAFPEDAQMAARMFLEIGPLLAEHEAISKAVKKHPMLRNAAPEILDESEAKALAAAEFPFATNRAKGFLGILLWRMKGTVNPPMKLPKD